MTHEYPLMEWTPERIKRFWDWQSQFPEQYFTIQFGRHIASHFRPLLNDRSVLDLGCGTGGLLPHLCETARTVIGADLSEASVATSNARCHGIAGFGGAFTIEALDKAGNRFDTILSIEVIEHLDDAALESLLATARSLLAPQGQFIVTTPNDEDLTKSYIYSPATNEVLHRWQHMRSWDEKSLPARLKAAGFSIKQTYTLDFSMEGNSRDARMRRLMQSINRLRGRPIAKPPHLVCVVSRDG
jgi:2-polyprenyl-3-methyl-5-hydroxy-6-metoxy-1,4-benzoquinol methylase